MQNGPIKPTVKVITLALVAVWAILVLEVTAADPPMWLLMSYTAFIFLLVGRMWGLEADYWLSKLNPITISLGEDNE
jgi:hypothetical protein